MEKSKESQIKDIKIKDFAPMIDEVMKQLKNGKQRFAVGDLSLQNGEPRFMGPEYSLRYLCLSGFSQPDFSETIMSDYGSFSGDESILRDFQEEIIMIEEIIKRVHLPINLADWQQTGREESEKMHKTLNLRAYAIQLWNYYAIPWRYKNNSIHFIWAPEDILGTPIIHSYSVDDFLTCIRVKLEDQLKNQDKIQKQLNFWKCFGIIVGIVVVLLLCGIFG